MSDELDRTFIAGNPNPAKYGWSLRACNGEQPDPNQIAHAARLLQREPFFNDDVGFECEIIAAAVHPDEKRIVYVESRAKEGNQFVDITIKIHYVDADGQDNAIDIESYNPFFGCDVGLIEWFNDQVAIMVYREKHWTFVYRVGDTWPPGFAKIEDRWQIKDDVLSYMAYKADTVRRLTIPSLTSLSGITLAEAESIGQLPPDPYAC
jgi:hypothetical protein